MKKKCKVWNERKKLWGRVRWNLEVKNEGKNKREM